MSRMAAASSTSYDRTPVAMGSAPHVVIGGGPTGVEMAGAVAELAPFRYRSRGDTAVIGRHSTVFVIGRWRLKKGPAWLM